MADRRPTSASDTREIRNLAPFIAWLASRVADEPTRRRCRLVAEVYDDWKWSDAGPASTRRSRFVNAAARRLDLPRAMVEEAVDRLLEHRAVVARTLPLDGR